jgi:RNA polymerase sigma-70 factor (ECF subfamily)
MKKNYVNDEASSRRTAGPEALKAILEGDAGKELHDYAHRLCGSRDGAQELVQESCYRALKSWRKFDQVQDLSGWLSRILRNCYFDTKRRESKTSSLDCIVAIGEFCGGELSPLTLLADGAAPAADTLVRREEDAAMKRAIARLSPLERRVLVLCDIKGETYKDAARKVGVSLGTFKSRLFRARASLRRVVLKRTR